jgi:hypothetical protein
VSDDIHERVAALEQRLSSATRGFRLHGEPDDLEEFFAFHEDDAEAQRRVIGAARAAVDDFRALHDAVAEAPARAKALRPLLRRFRDLVTALSVADRTFDPAPARALADAVASPPAAPGAGSPAARGDAAERARAALSFLVRTEEDAALLALVAAQSTGTSTQGDAVGLEFGRTRVELAPPRSAAPGIPASYGVVAGVHGAIRWKGAGTFGFTGLDVDGQFARGTWEPEALEEGGNAALLAALAQAGKTPSDIACAFLCGPNWILYDPTRTTTTGEPGLAFVSHGDCRWVALPQLDALDAGQVLLRLMAWQLAGQRGLLGDVYA